MGEYVVVSSVAVTRRHCTLLESSLKRTQSFYFTPSVAVFCVSERGIPGDQSFYYGMPKLNAEVQKSSGSGHMEGEFNRLQADDF